MILLIFHPWTGRPAWGKGYQRGWTKWQISLLVPPHGTLPIIAAIVSRCMACALHVTLPLASPRLAAPL